MKKRINTIDGKILVQGGTDNELKSNEIRVNADKTLTERVDGKIVSAGGGSGAGAKIVPLTNQCRVTFCDFAGGVTADGRELIPNLDGSFTIGGNAQTGAVRVFSPFLYVSDIANQMNYYMDGSIKWNNEKQCFDIESDSLPYLFTLSIIE